MGHPTFCDGKYTAPQLFLADRVWCARNFLYRYRLTFLDFEGRSHEAMTPLYTYIQTFVWAPALTPAWAPALTHFVESILC